MEHFSIWLLEWWGRANITYLECEGESAFGFGLILTVALQWLYGCGGICLTLSSRAVFFLQVFAAIIVDGFMKLVAGLSLEASMEAFA